MEIGMKVTKRQLRRIIKEEKRKLVREQPHYGQTADSVPGSAEVPPEFTTMCVKELQILIGEANMMGMSFPDIISEIQRCLDNEAEEGW
jgi:hypothetical protein